MNTQEYRFGLQHLSTEELSTRAQQREKHICEVALAAGSKMPRTTDDWELREILAELGRRQMFFQF